MKNLLSDFIELFFPDLCKVCNGKLMHDEKHICLSCFYKLPETNSHLSDDNSVEKRFWGKVETEHAYSFFKYVKDSDFHQLLSELKYKGCKELGEYLGEYYASLLKNAGKLSDIDCIIPVPLHSKRLNKRGYNQSEWIAKGFSRVFQKDLIIDNLYRKSANSTQTRKSVYNRWINVSDIFALKDPKQPEGKHILLVDDVLTTGSTITACAQTLHSAKNVRISIVTLALA
jgi:ComF family protein